MQSPASISFTSGETKGLVSIVMPTYRQEKFIAQSLTSIGRQTYPHWELLVVEDGSQGRARQIVEEFASAFTSHRIEYTRLDKNCGPSRARNVAFANARGEFVAMLDSDDRWLSEHLSSSVITLQEFRKDIAFSSLIMIEDETDRLLGIWGPDARDLDDFPIGLFRRNFINPSGVVLRRQVLADVGAWDTVLRCCEDVDFWLRSFAAGKQFQYVGGCHCLYRKNYVGSATERTCSTREIFAQVIARYTQLPGLCEATCRKLVCHALLNAARFHIESNPLDDASADPTRAPRLALSAWRLRPKNLEYLAKAVRYWLANFSHRRKPLAPPAAKSASSWQTDNAAA